MIFRLGEQKLDNFLLGEEKVGERQKRYMQCTMGSQAKCQKLGIFENFCVKTHLTGYFLL